VLVCVLYVECSAFQALQSASTGILAAAAIGVNPYAKPFPKPKVALTVGNGQCNIGMPNNVFDRFLWVINLYARAGGQQQAALALPGACC